MYAWYRDGHIVSLCRVCSSFVYAVRGEWLSKVGTKHGTWRSLKDRTDDQRGGSEWEPIKILLEGD
jgi:hypothetical protein